MSCGPVVPVALIDLESKVTERYYSMSDFVRVLGEASGGESMTNYVHSENS